MSRLYTAMKKEYDQQPFLPFSAPWFGAEEKAELLAALESDWITTGPRTKQFEKAFAAYVGIAEAVAVNSCTAALHLALSALNVGARDAVITTPFTFAATANVIVHVGAYPAFVDIDPHTYNLDASKLQAFLERDCVFEPGNRSLVLKSNGRRIKALIPVHYGGHPCDMDAINRIAARFELAVIEDAAHAVGAQYRGRKVGTLGSMACFSFYANKNMTTAEGGMLTTSDTQVASRVRALSMHGISKDAWKRYSKEGSWQYDVTDAGFKYNMTDLASALGLYQLIKLDSFIARRTQLAELYNRALAGVAGLKLPTVLPDVKSAWHLYPVQITSPSPTRKDFIEELNKRKIGCSVHFIPLHLTSFYGQTFAYREGDFPVAEQVFKRIVSLPLFPRMQDSDVLRVAREVREILDSAKPNRAVSYPSIQLSSAHD
jgi:dTDP-4-amino-4,6-dideoxygalactose transaminase